MNSARLQGRLSCIWSIYNDNGLDLSSKSSSHNDLCLVADVDYGEEFVGKVLQQAKDFSGGLYAFRKHVAPNWDSLSSGGHFRVEQSLLQLSEDEQKSSMADKFDFICDVVEEKLARSSMIAGVGLCRTSLQSMVLSLWLIGTDSSVVESLRTEVSNRVGSSAGRKATIRFIHHNSISSGVVSRTTALSVMPMLLHLAFPSINVNDLPAADEFGGLTPPGGLQRRAAQGSTPPLASDQSFQYETLNSTSFRRSSSMSVFEHHTRSSFESSALPAPTPVTDWASSWTPSMFFAAHHKSSTSTDSATATSVNRERTPSGTPQTVGLVPSSPQYLPIGLTALAAGGPLNCGSVGTQSNASSSGHGLHQLAPVQQSTSQEQPVIMSFLHHHHSEPYNHSQGPPLYTGPQPQFQQAPHPMGFHHQTPQMQNFPPESRNPQHFQPSHLPQPFTVYSHVGHSVHSFPHHARSSFLSVPPPQYAPTQFVAPTQQVCMSTHQGPRQEPAVPSVRPRGSAPQSERKPFVFRGRVFPPCLNRKEYRQIVHHCDDPNPPPPGLGFDRVDSFPAPPGTDDGDVELEVYHKWKASLSRGA